MTEPTLRNLGEEQTRNLTQPMNAINFVEWLGLRYQTSNEGERQNMWVLKVGNDTDFWLEFPEISTIIDKSNKLDIRINVNEKLRGRYNAMQESDGKLITAFSDLIKKDNAYIPSARRLLRQIYEMQLRVMLLKCQDARPAPADEGGEKKEAEEKKEVAKSDVDLVNALNDALANKLANLNGILLQKMEQLMAGTDADEIKRLDDERERRRLERDKKEKKQDGGGNNRTMKQKYLKYKWKYLDLKKSMGL